METIGPVSVFLSLVQLETLKIENCNKMQRVISSEREMQEIPKEDIITFPKLKFLDIQNMEKLKCFYDGSYKMAFPRLEKLYLCSLRSMKEFARVRSVTSFFPKTIEFPCLEELHLKEVSDEVVLWDLAEGEGPGISFNPLPNLKELAVVGELKLSSIVFPSLSALHLEGVLGDLKFLFSSSENEGCVGTYSHFPKLETLAIVKCPNSVQQFVNPDDCEEARYKFCGQLKNLAFQSALKFEVISLYPLRNLHRLDISGLKWEYIFSADGGFDQFELLENLAIYDCPNLEVLIRGGDQDGTLVFPRLKTLFLAYLGSMSKLCSISDIPLHFPSLDDLQIIWCSKLEVLFYGQPNQVVELPSLGKLLINNCNAMKCFSTRPLKAPKLHYLRVSGCSNMKSFSPAFLRASSLRELYVAYCNKWEWLFDGESNQVVELPFLEDVTVNNCNAMKSFSSRPLKAPKLRKISVSKCLEMEWFLFGNSNCNADIELPSLMLVTIKKCPNMRSFSPALLKAPSLRELQLVECNNLEWLFDGEPNQGVELPLLEQVTIDHCDAIKFFSSRPLKAPELRKVTISDCPEMEWFLFGNSNCNELPSLENVTIKKCPSMKSFSRALLKAPSLRELQLGECNKLEWLIDGEPDQVIELSFLEKVTIDDCDAIKSFSTRPLKAPKLREITVSKCIKMEWFLLENSNCNAELEFPSLERVAIKKCRIMKSFSPGFLRAPSLRELSIADCDKWEWLYHGEPNQVIELLYLEEVTIDACGAMKSFSTRPLKAPELRKVTLSNCPEMEMFLLGNSNDNADLELPSLENVTIKTCPNMMLFSPAFPRAPKLELVTVNDKNYPITDIENVNDILKSANMEDQSDSSLDGYHWYDFLVN